MSVFLSSVCFCLLAIMAWGREPPKEFMLDQLNIISSAREVTADCFPDADRVLVADHMFERYETNGTSVLWDDEYSKVLTEKGRRDAVTLKIPFDSHYGTSLVYRAEIIKPDGRILACDLDTYARVMIDPGQMQSNIYDPANKILTLMLPGLEIGDICHIITCRITTKARMPDSWADYAIFEYDSPIIKLDYAISSPRELPIRHKVLRAPIPGTVTYTEKTDPDGRTLHTWEIKNVPQMFPEPDMPPLHTQVQRLLLSTLKDWPTVSRWYWELCQPALSDTNAVMRDHVAELTRDATSREEKIRKIFKFVSQEIRYMGITTEDTAPGYEPHPVSLTYKNRYGVCRDKAALLVALLNLAGIPAYPVLIHAGAKMDPDVPLPYFNHAITAVDNPAGGYLLMDPTDETTRDLLPAYLCNRSYLVARPEGETLHVSNVYPAENNLTHIVSDGTLDASGSLVLKTNIRFEGINDNAYRGHLIRQKAEDRQRFFEGVLKTRLAGAEVLTCEIAPQDLHDTGTPLSVTLTSRVRDFPVRGQNLDLISLPWLGTAIGYANFIVGQTGLHKRKYPMDIGMTCGTRETVALHYNKALGTVESLPSDVQINREGVQFKMTQHATATTLNGHLSYLINTSEFSPQAYLALRETLADIEAASRRRPLFNVTEYTSPDQEVLSDVVDTHLQDHHTWTTTHTWSKRILTYAGKKNNSELKLTFNPAWQNMTLLAATVSNLNGEVQTIVSNEVNLMDAPWVGSAPRYPAEKTLVVNLPGVETGSVITVTTRASQTNAYFYRHRHLFGGTHPVKSQTYRLTYPVNLKPNVRAYHAESITATAVTNAENVTLTWQATDQPITRLEEQMPPWHFYRPTLFISFSDWESYAERLRHAFRKASKENSATRQHTKMLVRNLRDPQKRLLAIRNDVLRTIRPTGPTFPALPPDALSSPDRTLADQYGHPADRAILLQAMLEAAGFDSEIIFAANPTSRYPAYSQPYIDVPQIDFFMNPLVAVHVQKKTYYLNEGDQYDELGTSALNGAPLLTLRGKINSLVVDAPFQDRSESHWILDLDKAGTATITVTNLFFGTHVGPFRKNYEELLPESLRRHHLELVGAISKSAEPKSALMIDTKNYPCMQSFSVVAKDYADVENDTLTLLIPEVAGPVFPLRADTRENMLFLDQHATSYLSCEIILPAGYTQTPVLPEAKQWVLPNGLGSLDYSVKTQRRQDGRMTIAISRTIQRRCAEIPAECYPSLLEYNRRFTHSSVRTLVAVRKSLAK